MKIKKMNGIRNVTITTVVLVLALSSIDGYSQTKFKKVIKDGKVTYLPADNAETKAKNKPITQPSNKNQASKEGVAKESSKKIPKDIVLFESSQCNECRRIRRFFYKNKIVYTRKDIDFNKKFRHQLATKTGSTVTPALYIGKKRLDDLSTENLQKEFTAPIKEPKKANSDFSSIKGKKFNKSFLPNASINGKSPKNNKPLDSML